MGNQNEESVSEDKQESQEAKLKAKSEAKAQGPEEEKADDQNSQFFSAQPQLAIQIINNPETEQQPEENNNIEQSQSESPHNKKIKSTTNVLSQIAEEQQEDLSEQKEQAQDWGL